MDQKELTTLVRESGLEKTKAQYLLDNFSSYFEIAADWEVKARAIKVTEDTQVAEMKMAREGRLFLRAKRLEVENARKKLKEQSLREGKAIDGIANVLKAIIVPIEEYLDEQEHYVEMKLAAEEEARRIEADKALAEKLERERLEKEAEERRIREENEKLRKEAEAREAAIAKERAKVEREKKAAEEKARKEREAIEAKARAAAEAERKAHEAKLAEERRAREAEIAEERRKAAAAAERVLKEAEAKAEKERAEHEAQLAEAKRLASMVTCPKCGHTWGVDEEDF